MHGNEPVEAQSPAEVLRGHVRAACYITYKMEELGAVGIDFM